MSFLTRYPCVHGVLKLYAKRSGAISEPDRGLWSRFSSLEAVLQTASSSRVNLAPVCQVYNCTHTHTRSLSLPLSVCASQAISRCCPPRWTITAAGWEPTTRWRSAASSSVRGTRCSSRKRTTSPPWKWTGTTPRTAPGRPRCSAVRKSKEALAHAPCYTGWICSNFGFKKLQSIDPNTKFCLGSHRLPLISNKLPKTHRTQSSLLVSRVCF